MFTFEDLKRRLESRLRQKRQDFATRSIHLVEEPLLKGLKLRVGPHFPDEDLNRVAGLGGLAHA